TDGESESSTGTERKGKKGKLKRKQKKGKDKKNLKPGAKVRTQGTDTELDAASESSTGTETKGKKGKPKRKQKKGKDKKIKKPGAGGTHSGTDGGSESSTGTEKKGKKGKPKRKGKKGKGKGNLKSGDEASQSGSGADAEKKSPKGKAKGKRKKVKGKGGGVKSDSGGTDTDTETEGKTYLHYLKKRKGKGMKKKVKGKGDAVKPESGGSGTDKEKKGKTNKAKQKKGKRKSGESATDTEKKGKKRKEKGKGKKGSGQESAESGTDTQKKGKKRKVNKKRKGKKGYGATDSGTDSERKGKKAKKKGKGRKGKKQASGSSTRTKGKIKKGKRRVKDKGVGVTEDEWVTDYETDTEEKDTKFEMERKWRDEENRKAEILRLGSFDSMSSTGGPVIEVLGPLNRQARSKPKAFLLREGSVDVGVMTDLETELNISSSSSALNPITSNERVHKNQLGEIVALHKQMVAMQMKNYDLTRAVAKAGADTSDAVNLLLSSLPLIPLERGGQARMMGVPGDKAGLQIGRPPSEPKNVHVRVVFLRVLDIDTIKQQFEAEVYIEARWTEKKFQGRTMASLAEVEFFQCWDPQLRILNVMGDLDMEKMSMVLRYEPDSIYPVLVYMWHVRGTFRERMELQHFPFDVQELSIVLSSHLPSDHVDLLEEPIYDSSVNLGALQDAEEWKNYRHVEFTRDVIKREMDSSRKHPVLVVSAHVRRKLGNYFWNVGLIVFLILALTFTLLAVDPTSVDRLSIIMTLFLTSVAFQLVVRSHLPKISYLTYLDIYVVFAIVYLFLQGAESALMIHLSDFRDKDQVRRYDEISQACLIAFLIFFHLVFLIYIELTVLNRRRRMVNLDYTFQIKRVKKAEARKEKVDGFGASAEGKFTYDEQSTNT
ncbi:hypothetical protein EGW08_013647, partial [Elysia chlorotica]